MSTIETHHGHSSALVAAAAVVGILGAATVAGVAWHEHTAEPATPPTTHLRLPDYGPPVPPGGPAIHRAEARAAESGPWPTTNGRRVRLGQ